MIETVEGIMQKVIPQDPPKTSSEKNKPWVHCDASSTAEYSSVLLNSLIRNSCTQRILPQVLDSLSI